MSRMLCGLIPASSADRKGPLDARRGFDKIVEAKAFDEQYGMLPVQPDDKSRVWGANSFAVSPMFGGQFSEKVAQQRGFRMPAASFQEKGNHSGLWLAAVGHEAAATAPGMVSQAKAEAEGRESTSVRTNAGILGKLFVKRFGNCTSKGDETQVLVDNALSYAEQYALEAGLKRCNSRVGVTATRAGWFVRDVPAHMCNAEWLLHKALSEGVLSQILKARPYRMTESMPMSDALLGSLKNQGFVHQHVCISTCAILVSGSVAHAYGELQ